MQMGVEDYKANIKRRRDERLRLLKLKQAHRASSTQVLEDEGANKEIDELVSHATRGSESEVDYEQEQRVSSGFLLRVVAALFLFLTVYMVMNSEHQQVEQAQGFIQNAMTQDFDVHAVLQWYEQFAGEQPAFLPQLLNRPGQVDIPVHNEYAVPVQTARVVTAFGEGRQGVTLGTASSQQIEVIKDGLVIYAGESEGLGHTIVIDHGNGEESWYGHVLNPRVHMNDWVIQGQPIGYTTPHVEGGPGIFYFAFRLNSTFVNPLDVISFD
jgi:stage IV sporulation protein FA